MNRDGSVLRASDRLDAAPLLIGSRATAALPASLIAVWRSGWWAPLLLAALVVAVNPIGYMGGGADDFHYLQAARCWVEHGPCLPDSPWSGRWPVIAPVSVVFGLAGESRTTAAIAPALWWIGAIVALGVLGERLFGRRAGIIAASLLALVPIFSNVALSIGADVPELTLQLGAVIAGLTAVSLQSRGWAVVAGLLAATAFETRETSAAFFAASALICLVADRRRAGVLAWAVTAFAVAIVAELAIYGAVTGNPFFFHEVSLHHARLPTSELDPSVDRSRSPIFNPAFIAGWKQEMGIRLFWPLDTWLNFLASPRLGPVLIGAIAAALLWRDKLPAPQRRRCLLLALGAITSAAILIYVLAVDPQPRIFLGLAAAAALVLGALLSAARANGSRLSAILLVGGLAAFELWTHANAPSRFESERIARGWIAAHPGQIEIDGGAADMLALVKEAASLPPRGSGRPLLVALTDANCANLVLGGSKARLVGAEPNTALGQGGLCLFRY
jgi:4-amino-4-deoxy-L-arabinose transferase-like glycosyltransferase